MRYNSIENLIGCSHVGGLLASLRAGLLLNIVILSARESTAMVSLDTADAATSSLNLAAILLHHDLSSILLILCLILLAELGAEVVRDEFEYEGSDPGSHFQFFYGISLVNTCERTGEKPAKSASVSTLEVFEDL